MTEGQPIQRDTGSVSRRRFLKVTGGAVAGSSMLTMPGGRAEHFEGVGTISAVRRLLEYGWDRDAPPLVHARRVLFRLLAEDHDPDYLFEFGGAKGALDEDMTRRARAIRSAHGSPEASACTAFCRLSNEVCHQGYVSSRSPARS